MLRDHAHDEGKSDAFDDALVVFAIRYAQRAVADHAIYKKAIETGRLQAREA